MKEDWPDWEVYTRDRCTCVYCGFTGMGTDAFHAWRQLAIDHLVPTSRRGRNAADNKVVSCQRCNTMKGCFDPSGNSAPQNISEELRRQYIAKVKTYLNVDGNEERKDFERMMQEIRGKAAA